MCKINILILGALIGLSTSISLLLILKYTLQKINLNQLLDQQLNTLITTFQQQIPMGNLFLKGKLAEKLKTQAKDELIKIGPEIKENLYKKVMWKLIIIGTTIGIILSLILISL